MTSEHAAAIKHAEGILAELILRDDYSFSELEDAQYRLETAYLCESKYADLCISHGIRGCPSKVARPEPTTTRQTEDV